jgi:hypothetical protein
MLLDGCTAYGNGQLCLDLAPVPRTAEID